MATIRTTKTGRVSGYEQALPYLLLIPAFFIAGVVLIYPLLNGLRLSFTDYSLIKPSYTWIGFQNFKTIFSDPVYWEVFLNSIFIIFSSVAVQLLLGLAIALLLNKHIPLRGLFRSSVFIIWIIPLMVVALLWMIIFNSEFGILNFVLKEIGLIGKFIPWLGRQGAAKAAIIIVQGWRGVPFFMVMILAGLQTIPKDITDAATIDGANSVQRFFVIMLPFISHIVVLSALLSTVRLFQDITLIYILTNGGPVYATTTLAIHVYKEAFTNFQMGRAASIGVTWLIFLFILAVFYVRMVTKHELQK